MTTETVIPADFEAPAPGDDPKFDQVVANAWAVIVEKGNPEGITPERNRRTIAYAIHAAKAGTLRRDTHIVEGDR